MTEKTTFQILDEQWASDLQQGLEDYMNILYEAVYDMDEGESYEDDERDEPAFDPLVETESGIVFCGCNVCQYRETLAYVTPRIIEGYLERKVNIVKE